MAAICTWTRSRTRHRNRIRVAAEPFRIHKDAWWLHGDGIPCNFALARHITRVSGGIGGGVHHGFRPGEDGHSKVVLILRISYGFCKFADCSGPCVSLLVSRELHYIK